MEVRLDEGCALKVARALSYIDFSRLEKWYGELGFIKIFQGLRGEGTDLGWALLLGSIECALAGDRHLPSAIIDRILRDNRVSVQHLCELYPGQAPVRPRPGGFRVHGMEALPPEALPPLGEALDGYGRGSLEMGAMLDEMYRLHTPGMRDSLYYHAVLSAKAIQDPISAHVLWKAVRLLDGTGLPEGSLSSALERLERLQRQHLGAAMMREPAVQTAPLERFIPGGPPETAPATGPAGSYRDRAGRFLRERGIPEHPGRLGRFLELSGYARNRMDQLLEPFVLRSYCSDEESAPGTDLLVAVGPPGVDVPAMLESIARGFGFPFLSARFGDFPTGWAGELESGLLRPLLRARQMGENGKGLPALLAFSEGNGERGAGPRATTAEEVVSALAALLTGPRRREVLGAGARSPVMTVAAVHSASAVEPALRERLPLLRFEPPGEAELERLLIMNVVGRYLPCELDRINFPDLARQASGLRPPQMGKVAGRAKLAALDRRSRELGTRLHTASQRLRGRIRSTYMITQEDLSRAIVEEKRTGPGAAESRDRFQPRPRRGPPPQQTDLLVWGPGGERGRWRA